jgi:hypothetical protein
MLSIESIMGMIATDAIESGGEGDRYKGNCHDEILKPASYDTGIRGEVNLPPIQYDLELIQHPDGTYTWVE